VPRSEPGAVSSMTSISVVSLIFGHCDERVVDRVDHTSPEPATAPRPSSFRRPEATPASRRVSVMMTLSPFAWALGTRVAPEVG
jgi:hypothetical protein